MMSEHVSVRSTNIESVAYDPEAKVLQVRFLHGGLYQYAGVPALLADQLRASASPGGFFAARIKNSFQVSKV